MAKKIAVPAESLRRIAGVASREATRQESKGYEHNAESLRDAAEASYDAAAGKSASLVAIDGKHASAMAAFCGNSEYVDGLAEMLRHQNYW